MNFWSELLSADNSKVSTPQVVMVILGCFLMALSLALIVYHCFYMGKGIDGETVKLILGLMGGGVINAGASYFGKPAPPPPKANPAPPGEGER